MTAVSGRRSLLVAAAAAAGVVVLDQLTKWIVRSAADSLPTWLFDHVGVEIVHNSGISFSRFAGHGAAVVVAVAAVLLIVVALLPFVSPRYRLPLGLVLGGAAGNLIDRLAHGYVLDYLKLGPWPTFNVADIAIATGAVWIVVLVLVPVRTKE